MSAASTTDAEFIEAWKELGSPLLVARKLGIAERTVQLRRRRIEHRHGINLVVHNDQSDREAARRLRIVVRRHVGRVNVEMQDGVFVVFSDAHYYPGIVTTAHRGLLTIIRTLKPRAVICNGDAFDGSTISRHPRIGWDNKPSVVDELKTVTQRLGEVEEAAGRAELFWPLGNHDARFESFLAARAPEYQHVQGFRLQDHFPRWKPCWSVWVNDDVVIKHRYRSGIHAAHNNTVNGGVTVVTGHLHKLCVTPFSDYRGRRYGVDTGTLAEPYSEPFDYTEDSPVNWASGFAVLTWRDGKLLEPELVHAWDEGVIQFRGHLLDADTGKLV